MTGPGPVALVGSGEFLPVMEPVDAELLRGRPPRAAFLPTAAALEGDARVAYWLDLGRRHYEGMGVEPVPVPVRTRADADSPELAGLLRDVGLVYLSGGDPHHLSETLRGTRVWAAIVEAWHGGAALAGCSAGAMALSAGAPSLRGERAVADGEPNGLGLVAGMAVIPHFDRMARWDGALERFAAWHPGGTVMVGIDEETALVGDGASWKVAGEKAVWVFGGTGRTPYRAGEDLAIGA